MHRSLLVVLLLAAPLIADDRDKMTVGLQKDGSILTPTNQLLTPAGTQVLIKVKAAGVCHSDIHIWEGGYDLGHGRKPLSLKDRGVSLPRTMGHETVGEVVTDMRAETVNSIVGEAIPPNSYPEQWDLEKLKERTELTHSRIGAPQRDSILAAGLALQQAGVVDAKVDVKATLDALIDDQVPLPTN